MPTRNQKRRFLFSTNSIPPVTYDNGANDVFDAFPVDPTAIYKAGVNSDILSLKAGSNNYAKLDRFFSLDSQYEQNAAISWVNPLSSLAAIKAGDPFWRMYSGYRAFALGDYINTKFALNTGTNYTLNSACYFYWCNSTTEHPNAIEAGVLGGGSTAFAFTKELNGNNYSCVNDNSSGGSVIAAGNPYGLWSYVRINSTTIQTWHNGVLIKTSTINSNNLSTLEFFILSLNQNGSPQYMSRREISVFGCGSGTIDQVELYNTILAHRGWVVQTPIPALSGAILKLAFPSLHDTSGNGNHSALGADLPVGMTAPAQVGQDIVFNGNQVITLNSSVALANRTTYTAFIYFYCDTPETIRNLFNIGVNLLNGSRIYTANYWANIGGVFSTQGAATAPYKIANPKVQTGHQLFGISVSPTRVSFYYNGVISYDAPNLGVSAADVGGWIGAFPGTTGAAYTLPSYMTIPSGSSFDVYPFAATMGQLQAEGDRLMKYYDLSLCIYKGDSIIEGYNLPSNGSNWTPQHGESLLINTPYKWAFCNVGVPSRTLQTISDNEDMDGVAVSYSVFTMRTNRIKRGNLTKNIIISLFGVNDIAAGRSQAQIEADFVKWASYVNSQGYKLIVISMTGDSAFSGAQMAIVNGLNTFWANPANQAAYNYKFSNTAADPSLAVQPPPGASTNYTDGVHYSAYCCANLIAPVVYADTVSYL